MPLKDSVYASLATEKRNPRSKNIDQAGILEAVDILNREDRGVAEAVRKQRKALARAVALVVRSFRSGGRLFYVGAGTSGRLGVLDASECPPTFGTEPRMVQGIIAGGDRALKRSIEGAEDKAPDGAARIRRRGVGSKDVVCGIAASGVTPFVLGALSEAKKRGASTIFLSCSRRPLPLKVNQEIRVITGPEVVTGSTRMKAGTATKLVLNTLTTVSMIQLGKVYENLMVDLNPVCNKLKSRVRRILGAVGGLSGPEAERLFRQAGQDGKTAVVMIKAGVPAGAARRALKTARGRVREAITRARARE